MTLFRKRPVVIEAQEFFDGMVPDILSNAILSGKARLAEDGCVLIATLEGEMIARPGDWIIKGIKGEFYPCKPDIFKATYEKVDE